MNKKFEELKKLYEEICALNHALGLMYWDQRVMMPKKGAAKRAVSLAALEELTHKKFTDRRIGELAGELLSSAPEDSFEYFYLKTLRRDYEKAVKLPPEFVGEFAGAVALAFEAWVQAKERNDYELFSPHLEKITALNVKKAEILGYEAAPYDALLDLYEPGAKTSDLEKIFSELTPGLSGIIKKIAANSPKVSNELLKGDFPEEKQLKLTEEILKSLGYDFDKGRQDRSAHPFTIDFSSDDVRITTRAFRDYLPASVYASIHEGGHALYAQNSPAEFDFTPLSGGASLGIHESQSRFWENVVGRSLPFSKWVLPLYKKHFPEKFAGADPFELYKASNKVEATFIRVEADEVTYNLHIAVRFEIEKALVKKELTAKDAPAFWNEKMEKYLGIKPADFSEGILQDVHWSQGTIGYFPTYTLGNLVSAQLFYKMNRELDAEKLIERGEFAPLLGWMKEKIHSQGRKYLPEELLLRAIGEKINPEIFLDYVEKKYSAIYGF
ncbi:MAG: carboxypeptidase [Elusimicrobia bacterium CG08_land_8_20_14_0_20_51_18]|nr:MAG: carboxypeptidase [Elusimicrobia bacterium CG08_land_8_20_14_0_20_51_18]